VQDSAAVRGSRKTEGEEPHRLAEQSSSPGETSRARSWEIVRRRTRSAAGEERRGEEASVAGRRRTVSTSAHAKRLCLAEVAGVGEMAS